MQNPSRRKILALGAGGVAAVAVARDVRPAAATPEEAAAVIAKFTGGKTAVAEKGRIKIDLPEIAEDGNTVPLSIGIDSPMTSDDHVTDVLVVADANPRPVTATFHFTVMSGRATASTRMRLASTENVIVVAKTSDGRFFTEQKPVKVTIGGCGG
jgi:sulfur-oxidizing protein SoxY